MKLKFVLGSASLLLGLASIAHADTFDVRKNAEISSSSGLPTRGMSMGQVEKRFGAPVDKMPTATPRFIPIAPTAT